MKRVISLALFRSPQSNYEALHRGQFFPRHLRAILLGYRALFPGWLVRIHADDSVMVGEDAAAIFAAQAIYPSWLETVRLPTPPAQCCGMLWRLMPINDPEVDAFIARDIDSAPSSRDFRMVTEWLETGKALCCLHDSTAHCGPMMGGMIGLRPAAARPLLAGVEYPWNKPDGMHVHGADQDWMNRELFPRLKPSTLVYKTANYKPQENENGCEVRIVASAETEYDRSVPHIGAPFVHQAVEQWWSRHGDQRLVQAFSATRGLSRRVLLSSTVGATPGDIDYGFLLPYAVATWRYAASRQAAVILYGDLGSGSGEAVVAACRAIGADVYHAPLPSGVKASTAAQCSRLLAGALPIDEQARVITADADMLVLSRTHFEAGCDDAKGVTLFYGSAYEHEPVPRYPLSYIDATVGAWRAVTGLHKPAGDRKEETEKHLSASLLAIIDVATQCYGRDHQWDFDGKWISARICEWQSRGGRAQAVRRNGAPPVDRLDRSHWPAWDLSMDAVDAHMFRPAHSDVENRYSTLRSLCSRVVPPEGMAVLDRFAATIRDAGVWRTEV